MKHKIYAASEFFNELDMLEIRLETMYPYVDYFIISESVRTHSAKPKPLYYNENKDRFKKFHDKIIHQVITDTPITYDDLVSMKPKDDLHEQIIQGIKNANWLNPINDIAFIRDAYEKDYVVRAIPDADYDDIMIVGDLDEIPRPEVLKNILDNFDSEKNYLFQNEMYYMFFNLQKLNEPWWGINVLTLKNLLNNPISKIRQYKEGEKIDNGGWHFTYQGGKESIIKKLESFSHTEFDNPYTKGNVQYILDNWAILSVDALGRPSQFAVRDINDGTFPKFIVENQERFKNNIVSK
jgi:beta-1,4-mannosyl-glycoprotein beta-1,4-N-acetylglucosaminyltransferase